MKKILAIVFLTPVVMWATATMAVAAESVSVGGGLHYLRALGDFDQVQSVDLSQDSFGILGSVKMGFGLITVDGQVEYVFDHVGTSEAMWIPQAYGLVGKFLYGGAGIGIGYTDGDWQSDPFYALRAGVNFPLGGFKLDAYATYHFWSNDDLKNLTGEDLDSATLAAVLHFPLGGQ